MNNVITVNGIPFSTIEGLYDYAWTCPDLDSEFTWYKIDLAMTELKQAEDNKPTPPQGGNTNRGEQHEKEST